jgi:hypothetical protein
MNGESRPVGEPARGGLGLGTANPRILEIYTCKPASGALDKSQGRATTTAADVKNMASLAYAEKVRDLGLLRGSAPILLPDVLPIDFASQFCGELSIRVGISDAVKVRAALMLLDHFSSPGGAVTDHIGGETAEEVRSLLFGHQLHGRNLFSGEERAASFTSEGAVTLAGDWGTLSSSTSPMGIARLEGAELCLRFGFVSYCGIMVYNPGGTRALENEFIWLHPSGRYSFSRVQ